MERKTRSQEVADDVVALLRARNPLLWIITREEARVEQYLFEAAAAAGFMPRTWDVAAGLRTIGGAEIQPGSADIGTALEVVKTKSESRSQADRAAWIFRDAPVWLEGMPGAQPCRALRNLARSLPGTPRDQAQAIVVLTPSANVPAELSGHATVIEWPLPDRAEIAAALDAALNALPDEIKVSAAPNGTRDAAIDAAVGLTGEEAAACFAKSLVQTRRIDPKLVAGEKKRVIAKAGVLEWLDPIQGGLDAVGGLETLKGWLLQRALAYSPKARAYGLKPPKGALLVGPPGTGKTYTAKAIATAWGVPLLKLDMGALKSKFVGESEGNLRKALGVIEAIGRCVVLVDEIEKALAGATQGAADGGVSADALGTLLGWMNDRSGEGFVLATSNAADVLPPELMRKGRFDDVWFCDLPTAAECADVLAASIRANGRTVDILGLSGADPNAAIKRVAHSCDGFTGSEIAAIVPGAMFKAFADGEREITEEDLLAEARTVIPLSKTSAEKIDALRKWAAGRARLAGKRAEPETLAMTGAGRVLDL